MKVQCNIFLTDDSDEEDDFLSSAKDQNIYLTLDNSQDSEAVEPQKTESKKKKPLTKYAVVKKLLKKNLQVNKRVVFDEEGEEILDPRKQQVKSSMMFVFSYDPLVREII